MVTKARDFDTYAADLQRSLGLLQTLSVSPEVPDETSATIDAFIQEMERPVIKVLTDRDPTNPRDDDNAGVMFCQHRRYTLGDKDAKDPFNEVEGTEVDGRWMDIDSIEYAMDMLGETYEVLEDRIEAMREDPEHAQGVLDFGPWTLTAIDTTIKALRARRGDTQTRRFVRDDIAIAIPLSLYDHSGITIRHGMPADAWDSGLVGVHYMTRETLDREFAGDEAKARACMDAELRTYDQYLRGSVWGFEVMDRAGRLQDSCWGFYGDELEETGMLEHFNPDQASALRDAWERRFD